MPSSIAVLARPVRIFWRSRLNESTAFFMPSSVSDVMSLIMVSPLVGEPSLLVVLDDRRADRLAADHSVNVATRRHVEHDDAHLVVAAQRERGPVHHAEVLLEGIRERHRGVTPCVAVLGRIL